DLALLLELPHLLAQPPQLLELIGRQTVIALAAIQLVLPQPQPQRPIADAELARDLTHRPARRLNKPDRLTPKLRRIRPLIPLWHNAPPSSPGATLTKRSDAVDRVPCGPVSRFGRPSTMIQEVANGTEGVPGGVPPTSARSGRCGEDSARGRAAAGGKRSVDLHVAAAGADRSG